MGNSKLCGGIKEFQLPKCNSDKPKKGKNLKMKITISIVFACIGATIVLICSFFCLSRKKKGESTTSGSENLLLPLEVSYQNLLKATNNFSSENLIGTGSFGSVYKGILDQKHVTIKVLNLSSPGASKSFIAECEALRNIRHRNLVKILTVCSSIDYRGNDFKALVYEFMVNGSLEEWLYPSRLLNESKSLSLVQRLGIAIDIGCALEYLQQYCHTPIVHCDLKPSNILLDDKLTACVGDFGLAKFLDGRISQSYSNQSNSSVGVKGTIGYIPAEYGIGGEVSAYGDIYSYGILLLEIFTKMKPTDDIFSEDFNLNCFVNRALPNGLTQIVDPILLQVRFKEDILTNHSNIDIFNEFFISIFEVGISCSVELPQKRMSISDAIAELSHIRNKLLESLS